METCAQFEKVWGVSLGKEEPSPNAVSIRQAPPESARERCRVQTKLVDRQQVVGRLLWIARTTRPDIAQVASAFGSRVLTWCGTCDKELRRCMNFLHNTAGKGLPFLWDGSVSASLNVHSDSDWLMPRSQSGSFGCVESAWFDAGDTSFEACCLPICWASRLQSVSADSSTTAELAAAHAAVKFAARCLDRFQKLVGAGLDFTSPVPTIFIDNQIALDDCRDGNSEAWFWYAKAIAARQGLLSTLFCAGLLRFEKIDSEWNRADGLTKCFAPGDFKDKSRQVCVVDLSAFSFGTSSV